MIPQDNFSVLVFCGSGSSVQPAHRELASDLGASLAKQKINIVYGGGNLGVMGVLANSAMSQGGHVVGVLPKLLNKPSIVSNNISELVITEDFHERKRIMFESSDMVVALPGGIGTLEELSEVITLKQLGMFDKSIVLANIGGFWNPLLSMIDHMRSEGYIHKGHDFELEVANGIEEIWAIVSRQKANFTSRRAELLSEL
jgi:uncharacterized protein (TIGR00730 family)